MEENPNESFEQTDQVAGVGRLVTIDLIDRSGQVEQLSLQIVPDASADFSKGFLGQGTPLARAIQGKRAGSLVPYSVGDMRQVRILSVHPAPSAPPPDVETRRQETINKAREDSERTSAIIFASSYSGKWGDYDPGAVEDLKVNKEDGNT